MLQAVSTVAAPGDKQPEFWHSLEIGEAIARLKTDPETGISSIRATQLLTEVGANELTAKKTQPWWLKFLLQFNQPLLIILLCAGLVKAVTGSFVNAGVIWGVTTTNAIIGFIQESKAESAISALAKAITTEATVLRDGQKVRVPSQELVPGDVVLLTSGDKVPADLRLIQTRNLQIDESALTGESVAVEKNTRSLQPDTPLAERKNMAYAGGFVTFGQGAGIVVATGNTTETGRISQLMEQHTDITTPLTRKFDKFSRNWLYMVLGLATLCFAVGLSFRGMNEALEAAVALTVSAIPEGLPAVVTVTLAIGVSRMARRNAIIRKLPAVETLGSATVICSDKTGTLTENQMTVQAIYAGGHQYTVTGIGYVPDGEILQDEKPVDLNRDKGLQECLIAGLLCNDSHLEVKNKKWVVMGDPTEGALIASANKAGFNQTILAQQMPRLDGIPFESDYQYMATLHETPRGKTIYVKGSVEAILQRCHLILNTEGQPYPLDCVDTLSRAKIEREVNIMARQGLRVLALAKKPIEDEQNTVDHPDIAEGLIFLGLQGMIDPPRESAIKAVQACQSAGIQVKMITGDHAVTAQAIARRMGINKNGSVLAFTGAELVQMDKTELAQVAEEGVVFARVAPEQKLRLVEALQSKGEVVAMTGDGVNDAPALKQADIGIAMGGAGTEVAKEASDMLLTDDNFASIEAAVEEGRAVYKNLIKAICFILPVNGGESMTILISTLLARDLPILSLQVLWLNMLNSITMTVPLAFEPKAQNVMQQPPRHPNEALLSGSRIQRILAISLFNWIVIFGVFEYIRQTTGSLELARTMAINSLIAGRIFYLLSISQLIPNLIAKMDGTLKENVDVPAIGFGILGAILLQIVFAHVPLINEVFETAPLTLQQWLFCLGVGSPMILWATVVNRLDPPN
ncbi:HAD-IC family P-type ATPase [Nostoc sp. FACHB-152]|uniref:HAD-IC family P-type ATPase n=1 Tax=unclassified Nostoc TaxID=2593658 RepID=UPI001681E6D5|nr:MULTISPECIES: HAD-IC family P-type ATPase [unclassified Nostoc]MBD2450203.1 HAD-IC family P-type ATPase [Nostoc sp. FACHB-152]MBD2469026.1 HAD-IC family P-type ATPase [Nostoc sp. FACHB-145]